MWEKRGTLSDDSSLTNTNRGCRSECMSPTESLVRQFEYVGVEGFLMWFVSTCPL